MFSDNKVKNEQRTSSRMLERMISLMKTPLRKRADWNMEEIKERQRFVTIKNKYVLWLPDLNSCLTSCSWNKKFATCDLWLTCSQDHHWRSRHSPTVDWWRNCWTESWRDLLWDLRGKERYRYIYIYMYRLVKDFNRLHLNVSWLALTTLTTVSCPLTRCVCWVESLSTHTT